MNIEIDEGVTLINRYGDHYNTQFIPKNEGLNETLVEIKEFLKACGFNDKAVDEAIDAQ
jgi:hypothetical protein